MKLQVRTVTISMYDADTGEKIYNSKQDCQFTYDNPLPRFVSACLDSFCRGVLAGRNLSIHVDCEDVRVVLLSEKSFF